MRAIVSHLHDRIIVINTAPRVANAGEEENIIVLYKIVMKNPRLDWFNSYIFCSEKPNSLTNSIISGTALSVSDGYYYLIEEVGACAWTISTPDGKESIKGGGIISGQYEDQNSYRADLGDQLEIATFF